MHYSSSCDVLKNFTELKRTGLVIVSLPQPRQIQNLCSVPADCGSICEKIRLRGTLFVSRLVCRLHGIVSDFTLSFQKNIVVEQSKETSSASFQPSLTYHSPSSTRLIRRFAVEATSK